MEYVDFIKSLVKAPFLRKFVKYSFIVSICLIILCIGVWQYSTYKLTHPKVIYVENINNDILKNRLALAHVWYSRNSDLNNGNIALSFNPVTYVMDERSNPATQLNAFYMFSKIESYLKVSTVNSLIQKYLINILQYQVTKENYAYIEYAEHAYLNYNAFLVELFLNTDYYNKSYYVTLFANGLLAAQQMDGSYLLDFKQPSYSGREAESFPGQAIEALMNTYAYTKNPVYINSVIKAYPYYKDYWYAHKSMVTVAMLTPGLVSLYNETKNMDVYNTLIDMNNYLISNQINNSNDVYERGHFKMRNGYTTSLYVESLNLVYPIITDLKLKQKYKSAIQMGIQNILPTQYQESDLVFYPDKYKHNVIGGFIEHVNNSNIHLNYTVRGIQAIMLTIQNKIFP